MALSLASVEPILTSTGLFSHKDAFHFCKPLLTAELLVASPLKRIDPAVRLPQFDPKARHPQATTKEKLTRGATGMSALSNSQNIEIIDSHNFASCFTPLERSEAR
jgi:hypothetical protein